MSDQTTGKIELPCPECAKREQQDVQYFEVPRAEGEPPEIVKLTYEKNAGLNAWMKHPMLALLAEEFAKLFHESGAVNYLETSMMSPQMGEFTLTIQRKQGKTPHQFRMEAEAQIAELQKDRERLDWLEGQRRVVGAIQRGYGCWYIAGSGLIDGGEVFDALRTAIDAAMKH